MQRGRIIGGFLVGGGTVLFAAVEGLDFSGPTLPETPAGVIAWAAVLGGLLLVGGPSWRQ